MRFFSFIISFSFIFLIGSMPAYAYHTNMTNVAQKSKSDTVFILIHGAGFGSWIWEKITPLLSAPVIVVDMPARTEKVNTHTFDEYTQIVTDAINSVHDKKVILVGHSIGMEFALAAANKTSDKIAGIVAVSGLVPESGKSYYSLLPSPQRFVIMFIALFNGNGLKPPATIITSSYSNDLDKKESAELLERYAYESPKIFSAPVVWDKIPQDIPRYYIKFTNDKSGFSSSQQEEMAKKLQAKKVFSLDTGHLGMISKPKEFAKILNSLLK